MFSLDPATLTGNLQLWEGVGGANTIFNVIAKPVLATDSHPAPTVTYGVQIRVELNINAG